MEINTDTQLCGVLGHPVKHSLSPAIHNAAFQHLGLNYVYLAFPVEDVPHAIDGIRALGNLRGFSVTIPHKVSVMAHLDTIEPTARHIGAVNTIVKENQALSGYNTDASGALLALRHAGVDLAGKHVVMIGSGGAARAIAFGLALQTSVSRLTILGIEEEERQTLAGNLREGTTLHIEDHPLNADTLEPALDQAQVMIHCTPVGMDPHVDQTCVPQQFFPSRPHGHGHRLQPVGYTVTEGSPECRLPHDPGPGNVPAPGRRAIRVVDGPTRTGLRHASGPGVSFLMNLVLIGYRGTGKSTVAKLLATQLGWKAISTDAQIVEQAQRSIPDIVASDGWEHFRNLETEVCLALKDRDRLVIDTGGGLILRSENVEALKPNSLIFWLTATVATITRRIADNTQRPALTAGKTFVEEIQEVLTERTPKYQAAADHTIATDDHPPEAIADHILNMFAQHESHR